MQFYENFVKNSKTARFPSAKNAVEKFIVSGIIFFKRFGTVFVYKLLTGFSSFQIIDYCR